MDVKVPEIAYSVRILPQSSDLEIRKTANAWWLNKNAVDALVAAFRIGMTIQEACAYVGITKRQYKYFVRLHPQIRDIRKSLDAAITFRARLEVIRGTHTDYRFAMKYLEKKLPAEFGRQSLRKKKQPVEGGGVRYMEPKQYNVREVITVERH